MTTQSVADFGWLWKHLWWGTGGLVATDQGVLHTIVINRMGTKDSFAIYDGIDATGRLLGMISTTFDQPVSLLYDLKYKTGLFVDIFGDWDLTVNYK